MSIINLLKGKKYTNMREVPAVQNHYEKSNVRKLFDIIVKEAEEDWYNSLRIKKGILKHGDIEIKNITKQQLVSLINLLANYYKKNKIVKKIIMEEMFNDTYTLIIEDEKYSEKMIMERLTLENVKSQDSPLVSIGNYSSDYYLCSDAGYRIENNYLVNNTRMINIDFIPEIFEYLKKNFNPKRKINNIKSFKKIFGCFCIQHSLYDKIVVMTVDFDTVMDNVSFVINYENCIFKYLVEKFLKEGETDLNILKLIESSLRNNDYLLDIFPELNENKKFLELYLFFNKRIIHKCSDKLSDAEKEFICLQYVVKNPNNFDNLPQEIQEKDIIWKASLKGILNENKKLQNIFRVSGFPVKELIKVIDKY